MRLFLAILVWLGLALGYGAHAASDDEFHVPGLEQDSQAYALTLRQKSPAGLSVPARRQALQRLDEATKKADAAGQVSALEILLSGQEASAAQWVALGRALLAEVPPDAVHAAQAAWKAFSMSDAGAGEIPALLLMADAFHQQGRLDFAVQALEAVLTRAPDDKETVQRLAAVRQEAGILVRRITTETEAEPAQACIAFTTVPSRRSDFVPSDWVRLSPATPDAAITRQGDQLCIAGLRLGATTQVRLRAGMPGEDGLKLNKDVLLNVAMPNRSTRLSFDSRMFVLPRGQVATVTLTTVNLSKVKLRMLRLTERNAIAWSRDTKVGDPLDRYQFDSLADSGKVVWEGTADLPHWQQNKSIRTALPLPDEFKEPGVYLLLAIPGDGSPEFSTAATQVVLRTDLAPTVWRGTDGLTVQVRALSDAAVRGSVHLRLLSHANDILAEADTGPDGVARFAAPLLHGTGPQAPEAIQGFLGEDFVELQLSSAAFDLSDRGVEGAPQPGPLDAFAWTDRGIYRPGETVQFMALLRDDAGLPRDLPVHVSVKRPNGQVYIDLVPPRGGDASVYQPIALSGSASAGVWTVDVLADPKSMPIGRTQFRVDAFVPDRMAVEAVAQGPIMVGKPYALPVSARFLYGAPAANLSGNARINLVADATSPQALPGYKIGLEGEIFAPDALEIPLPTTDPQGKATLPILLKTAPDSTRPVKAEIDVAVDDPSGRASHAHLTIPVRSAGNLLGIKPGFPDSAIDAGGEASFEMAAIDPDGKRVAVPAKLKLVRERPDWRLVMRGTLARYETVYRDEPIEQKDVMLPADMPFQYTKRLDFGRYRLDISETNGLGATSIRFRAGWVASDSPDTPDKVDVSTDRRMYKPGEIAKLHVVSPFAGHATILTLTDRVHSLVDTEIMAGGTDVDVPVDASWGPGSYATVHVFRGMNASSSGAERRPSRAIGLAWIGIDPATRTLPLVLDAPDKVVPRTRTIVPVKTSPGAWVTLAAVDEGVLRLTSFVSPDPGGHYLGRRSLGIDIRDDWGRLIGPGEGEATVLHQGGDDAAHALPEIPQKVVALFTPPRQAGPDGVALIPIDLPDFAGQVRLMAVGWQGSLIGSTSVDMLVRDPLIAEPLLPRFLAPGDTTRLAVLMQNLELPAGEAIATVSVDGPLQIVGEARLVGTLQPNQQVVRTTELKATGVGRGVIHLSVTGPGGFSVQRETGILIRPARAPSTVIASGEIGPSAEVSLQPALAQMIPGTGTARAVFGGAVRYDVAALLEGLRTYPLACLEQSASEGLPLAMLPDGPLAGDDRAGQLQRAVGLVLDKQRFDGGFGLWSANGEVEGWLSAYATEFLLRAQKGGAAVPEGALRDALKFIADATDSEGQTDQAALATKAYNLYVLAFAGHPRAGANRMMAEAINSLPTPLAKAQIAAALALSNDRPRAEAAFNAALAGMARRDWYADRGSAFRDVAATVVLLKESGLLPDKLAALLAALPGADLEPATVNTQEAAWAIAASAVMGRDGRLARVVLDGRALPPAGIITALLTGPATARNLDNRPVWETVSTSGVMSDAPPATRNQMRVTRQFFALNGDALNLDQLKQNTVFVLLIEGRADDGQSHSAMLLQGLPAGWEIAGRMGAGKTTGMPWLGELSETDSQPAADDRFAATMMLTKDAPVFRVAVRLRAVTPGEFEIPGAELSDMYRPAIFARQASNRIKVLAPE
jgi:uncharacterized protein YfaS (alpha-2-macroglobulin family)